VCGGGDLRKAVCRVMTKAFTNSLAQQYNWIGTGKKHSFQVLQLREIICGELL